MRTLVAVAPGQVSCLEVPHPTPREGKVLVAFQTGLFTAGTLRSIRGNAAQVVEGFTYPRTIGGTAIGRVVDPGGSERLSKGDKVLVSNVVVCGNCDQCRRGADNLCENRQLAGIQCEGTFSESLLVDERRVFPVDESVDDRLAVLVTEVAVLVNALEMGWEATEKRHHVTVIGTGSLGIHAIWLARQFGATTVHAVDPSPERLAAALQMGADVAMTPDEYDRWVNENLAERGAGTALVVTDHKDAILQGCRALQSRGCVVCVGLPEGDLALVPGYYPNLMAKELTLRGCYAKSGAHISRALDLLKGRSGHVVDEYVAVPIAPEGAERLVEIAGFWPDGRRYVVTHAQG